MLHEIYFKIVQLFLITYSFLIKKFVIKIRSHNNTFITNKHNFNYKFEQNLS